MNEKPALSALQIVCAHTEQHGIHGVIWKWGFLYMLAKS